MPSCGITEQFTVRDSPADATLLKGFILTTGGEGTAMKGKIHITPQSYMNDYTTHD